MHDEQFLIIESSYAALGVFVKNLFSSILDVTLAHNEDGQIDSLNDLQIEANRYMIHYALIKPDKDQSFIFTANQILALSHSAKAFFRSTRNISYEKNGRRYFIRLPRRSNLVHLQQRE